MVSTCSHLVHDLYINYQWVVYDLIITCSRLIFKLPGNCSSLLLAHKLFRTCWLIFHFFKIYPCTVGEHEVLSQKFPKFSNFHWNCRLIAHFLGKTVMIVVPINFWQNSDPFKNIFLAQKLTELEHFQEISQNFNC